MAKAVNEDSLNLNLLEDGTGASDHTSFYYKKIPVLHYFTGTHSDYHRPSDDLAYIEKEGLELVVAHVAKMVDALGPLSKEELPFVETPEKKRQSMTTPGVLQIWVKELYIGTDLSESGYKVVILSLGRHLSKIFMAIGTLEKLQLQLFGMEKQIDLQL